MRRLEPACAGARGRSSIINAGDGTHEHPTQALLDAFTITERKGRLAGLRVAIVGDLLHSRVLRSNVLLLTRMGADVVACGPATLIPLGLERLGVTVTTSIDEACEGADVVMMLRVQHERMHGLFCRRCAVLRCSAWRGPVGRAKPTRS
jgi:aspartate carbamoyltransferase catalytic subunit